MVAHSSTNRLDLSSESTSIIKQCKSRRNIVATSQSTTCDSINLLHPIMKVPHCVSAHTFRRSTRMRNRFTLSGAPHMKIINSSWKVEGTRNCKLLRCSPPARRCSAKEKHFNLRQTVDLVWICRKGQRENVYRNKLSSGRQQHLRFIV